MNPGVQALRAVFALTLVALAALPLAGSYALWQMGFPLLAVVHGVLALAIQYWALRREFETQRLHREITVARYDARKMSAPGKMPSAAGAGATDLPVKE